MHGAFLELSTSNNKFTLLVYVTPNLNVRRLRASTSHGILDPVRSQTKHTETQFLLSSAQNQSCAIRHLNRRLINDFSTRIYESIKRKRQAPCLTLIMDQ